MNYFRASVCSIALASAFAGASLPAGAAAQPTCAAGDPVVWENTSTKVYHEQGDKYYGKTKSGAYACKSDAEKGGFHLAKSRSAHDADASATAPGASPAPDAMTSPAPGASPKGKHHHHHKGSAASPMPSAT